MFSPQSSSIANAICHELNAACQRLKQCESALSELLENIEESWSPAQTKPLHHEGAQG